MFYNYFLASFTFRNIEKTLFAMHCIYSAHYLTLLFAYLVSQQFLTITAKVPLLYPQFSVLQITIGIGIPVADLPKHINLNVDEAFQMNYDMPFNLSSFYNVPIWPYDDRSRFRSRLSRETIKRPHKVHPNDITAGQLYRALKELLYSYGFHPTCLQQLICELALDPFTELQNNPVTEFLIFVLRPSIHRGFSEDEQEERFQFYQAESHGRRGSNCSQLYSECSYSFLSAITPFYY